MDLHLNGMRLGYILLYPSHGTVTLTEWVVPKVFIFIRIFCTNSSLEIEPVISGT